MKQLFLVTLLICLIGLANTNGQTILQPGDLAVVGLASNVGGELGGCSNQGQFQGRDRVSFVCFKDIQPGTAIDITDNGWERVNPGMWGNTEGFVRAIRTGGIIPAGTIITFEFPPTAAGHEAVAPDAEWDFQLLGTNALNFNDSGDQMYFMQGGSWDNGTTIGCCNGEQDATYSGGNILFGFNSRSVWNAGIDDSQSSGQHPDIIPCFSMAPTSGVTSFTSYTGPVTNATHLEWISRIANPDNWTAFAECEDYQDPPSALPIAPSGMFIDCTVCQSCAAFADTLIFSLPLTGAPFVVEYAGNEDTLLLAEAQNGLEVPIFVSDNVQYKLISVTDANGCPVYSNFENGAAVSIVDEPLVVTCNTFTPAPDGSAEIMTTGGVPPYMVVWTNAQGATDTVSGGVNGSLLIDNLETPGTYQLTVTDAGGCVGTCEFILNEQTCDWTLTLEATVPTCNDPNTGQIQAVVSGTAAQPLTYQWSEGFEQITTDRLTQVTPGQYTVTVTDAAGCVQTASTVLEAETGLTVDAFLEPDMGCRSSTMVLQVNSISGGVPPYTYELNGSGVAAQVGAFPFQLEGLLNDNYVLTIEDAAGCRSDVVIQALAIEPPISLNLTLGPDIQIRRGQSAVLQAQADFDPTSVSWLPSTGIDSPRSLTTAVRPDQTTQYILTAWHPFGCSISDTILVEVLEPVKVFIPTAFSPNNDGVNDQLTIFAGVEVVEIRSFRVFDRWGNMVFDAPASSGSDQSGWDGTTLNGQPATAGVYLYFTEYVGQNGLAEVLKGEITLLR